MQGNFTISSSLVMFLQACAILLCPCLIHFWCPYFIHFCIPGALLTPGHISMECPLRYVWILNNLPKVMRLIRKTKKKENGLSVCFLLLYILSIGLTMSFSQLALHLPIKSTLTAMGRFLRPLIIWNSFLELQPGPGRPYFETVLHHLWFAFWVFYFLSHLHA